MLKYSKANSKLEELIQVVELRQFLEGKRKVYSLDLLSGFSCPYAKDCLSKVVEKDGKRTLVDGPHTLFRCFSASQEVVYTNTYNRRKENFEAVKGLSTEEMFEVMQGTMPKNLGICRIHVAGDFFSQNYFDAWVTMAKAHPDRLFYAYTKSLTYWLRRRDDIPENLVLTASFGGRLDNKIETEKLRSSVVVYSVQEAIDKGLEIDHTDEHAAIPSTRDQDFALLIHGTQPKGSDAGAAIKELKAKNVKFSYSRKVVNA